MHSLGESHHEFCQCSLFVVWYCHTLLSRTSSARTPTFQTMPPSLSTLLTILLTMPLRFFFEATTQAIQYGRRIARIIAIRALAWAQAMAVRIALKSVERMCRLAVKQAARCVFVCFILAVLIFMLTFIRANEMVAISMHKFFASISDGSNRAQGALAGVMLAMGEVAFFGLAVHLLDQVISLSFFFFV